MARETELTVGADDCTRCFGAEIIDCPQCNAESVYYCEVCCGVEGCDCVLCRGVGSRFCLKCKVGETPCPECNPSGRTPGVASLVAEYDSLMGQVRTARTTGRLDYIGQHVQFALDDGLPWTKDDAAVKRLNDAWVQRYRELRGD